jgi:hypothetical protein
MANLSSSPVDFQDTLFIEAVEHLTQQKPFQSGPKYEHTAPLSGEQLLDRIADLSQNLDENRQYQLKSILEDWSTRILLADPRQKSFSRQSHQTLNLLTRLKTIRYSAELFRLIMTLNQYL